MTFDQALDKEPAAFKDPIFLETFDAICGTGRPKAAAISHKWGKSELVETDEKDTEVSHPKC